VLCQETILKRAADLAEVLYSMPRAGATGNHQLAPLASRRSPAIPPPPPLSGSMSTSPPSSATFSSYVGHLDAAAASNGHWDDSGGWSHRYPSFSF